MERLFDFPVTELSHEEMVEQDRVHSLLTDAVRELCEAQLLTTIPMADVENVTAEVRTLTERLLRSARGGSFGMELDHTGGGREHGNAVLGLRNPFAVAVGKHSMFWHDGRASAELHLGPVYEGPSGCVHGGVIALIMDQLFTEAAAAAGQLGMTATIAVTYRRPVALGDVSVEAWVERVDGAKRTVRGEFRDAEGNVGATAEALLILPKAVLNGEAMMWPKRPPRVPSP